MKSCIVSQVFYSGSSLPIVCIMFYFIVVPYTLSHHNTFILFIRVFGMYIIFSVECYNDKIMHNGVVVAPCLCQTHIILYLITCKYRSHAVIQNQFVRTEQLIFISVHKLVHLFTHSNYDEIIHTGLAMVEFFTCYVYRLLQHVPCGSLLSTKFIYLLNSNNDRI